MEPAKHFLVLYHRMRLTVYRRLLHRTGRLSAADAIAADVIYLLERPTLTQFAGEGDGHFPAQRHLPGQ